MLGHRLSAYFKSITRMNKIRSVAIQEAEYCLKFAISDRYFGRETLYLLILFVNTFIRMNVFLLIENKTFTTSD